MLGIVLNLALAGIVLGAIGYTAASYLKAPKTMMVNTLKPEDQPITRASTVMDKLSYATKKSAVLFVNLSLTMSMALGKLIMDFSDFIGAPEVRAWVTDHTTPEIGAAVILGILAVTTWARVRNAVR